MPSLHNRKTGEGKAPRSRCMRALRGEGFQFRSNQGGEHGPRIVTSWVVAQVCKDEIDVVYHGESYHILVCDLDVAQHELVMGSPRMLEGDGPVFYETKKMRDGWISGMNMAAHYPRPPSCRLPALSLPYPAGPQVCQEGGAARSCWMHTLTGLSPKVDINSCFRAPSPHAVRLMSFHTNGGWVDNERAKQY